MTHRKVFDIEELKNTFRNKRFVEIERLSRRGILINLNGK